MWGLSFMFIRKMANPGKVVSRWVGLGQDTTGSFFCLPFLSLSTESRATAWKNRQVRHRAF